MRAITEDALRDCFVNATKAELDRLPLPGLHEMVWSEREYLGWRDPQAAQLGYLAHWQGDRLVGIVLRASSGSSRPGVAGMCQFCHSTQPATQVRLFSAVLGGEGVGYGSSIGTYICGDLACSWMIRTGPAHLTSPERVARRGTAMLERVSRFTARVQGSVSDTA